MGGTFRFMTYFVEMMAFLCAYAYKKELKYTCALPTDTEPFKETLSLYIFYLRQSHCV